MTFVKATKEQIWLKVFLNAPSGGGKTYSALRLAKGIAKACGSKIAAIDTENRRIRYYADEFDFDDMTMEAPYSPEKYIEAIQDAIDGGYKVLIIDSMTHEWTYCLDLVNNMPGTNTYTKWKTVTPRHDAFKENILQAPVHIIATVRGKDEYTLEEQNGRKVPKKVGLGYSQRDGLEFDYTVSLNLDQDTHRFQATKDNTHLFEGRYDVLTEKDGEALYAWANQGTANAPVSIAPEPKTTLAAPAPAAPETPPATELDSVIADIDSAAQALSASGMKKPDIAKVIKEVTGGMANYKNITDIEVAKKVLAALNAKKEAA